MKEKAITIRNGILYNTGSAPFVSNHSMSFDGVDENIDLGAPDPYMTSSALNLSWSVWVKPTDATLHTLWMFKGGGTYWADMHINWTGALRCRFAMSDATTLVVTKSFTNDVWYHIVLTYDGTQSLGSRCKIYIDGVSQTVTGDTAKNTGFSWTTGGAAKIGSRHDGTYPGNVQLMDLGYWEHTLAQAEVTEIYNSHAPYNLMSLSNKPKHWWRIGEGDDFTGGNWTVHDVGVDANYSGTSVNMEEVDLIEDVPS